MGHDEFGLQVLPRRGRSFNDAAADLAQRLLRFCQLDRRERIAIRSAVERQAAAFDWSRLADSYHAAHGLAVDRAGLATPR